MNAPRTAGRRRKTNSLSKDLIVQTAVEILDAKGLTGLTVRSLAERLQTGSGSIYWHVGDRNALLDLACDQVLAEVAATPGTSDSDARQAIRTIGVALFDSLEQHPWAGAHLPSATSVSGLMRALDRIGILLDEAGVPEPEQFNAATAIITYVLGVAAQMTRNAEHVSGVVSREEWLAERARTWEELDADAYPFLHRSAAEFRGHDDRKQFLAGLDLILAGLDAQH